MIVDWFIKGLNSSTPLMEQSHTRSNTFGGSIMSSRHSPFSSEIHKPETSSVTTIFISVVLSAAHSDLLWRNRLSDIRLIMLELRNRSSKQGRSQYAEYFTQLWPLCWILVLHVMNIFVCLFCKTKILFQSFSDRWLKLKQLFPSSEPCHMIRDDQAVLL